VRFATADECGALVSSRLSLPKKSGYVPTSNYTLDDSAPHKCTIHATHTFQGLAEKFSFFDYGGGGCRRWGDNSDFTPAPDGVSRARSNLVT
jgi:hypothetical protein